MQVHGDRPLAVEGLDAGDVGDRVDGVAKCTPLASADARGAGSTGNRTYWAVFFGRRAQVSLQLPYWRALHERGLVDELEAEGVRCWAVGGARETRKLDAARAIREATELCATL